MMGLHQKRRALAWFEKWAAFHAAGADQFRRKYGEVHAAENRGGERIYAEAIVKVLNYRRRARRLPSVL